MKLSDQERLALLDEFSRCLATNFISGPSCYFFLKEIYPAIKDGTRVFMRTDLTDYKTLRRLPVWDKIKPFILTPKESLVNIQSRHKMSRRNSSGRIEYYTQWRTIKGFMELQPAQEFLNQVSSYAGDWYQYRMVPDNNHAIVKKILRREKKCADQKTSSK